MQSIQPIAYSLEGNDEDWIHRNFSNLWEHQQRLSDLGGVRREHSLYGVQTTRLSWIYPPSHSFIIKPQALLMPEITPDDDEVADSSFTSMEGVDGDASFDSLGGEIVSTWRDIFIRRGRREVDILVTKDMSHHNERDSDVQYQVALLVVEMKRDDLEYFKARDQIEDYMTRILLRLNASSKSGQALRGLLVMGKRTVRLEGRLAQGRTQITYIDGYEAGGEPITVETDCGLVNGWLVEQANWWAHQ